MIAVIRLLIKSLILFLCFSIQIHVKADSSLSRSQALEIPDYVEEPQNCLRNISLVCGIKTRNKEAQFQDASAKISLAKNSILIRVGKGVWYLSKGSVLVQSLSDFQLKTSYGAFSPAGEMNLLVTSDAEGITAVPLLSNAVLSPSGSLESVVIDPGLQIQLDGFNKRGQGDLRVPLSTQPKHVIEQWGQLFTGSPQEFTSAVSRYLELWQTKSSEVASTQKSIMQREIASAEEERRIRVERQKRLEAESRKLRSMFRDKNYY